jgi:hypothetical protein
MKARNNWVGLGLATVLGLLLSAAALSARERYEDKEVWGTVVKVDPDKHLVKLDRGVTHKPKLLKWNHKTQFRTPEKKVEATSLKAGQKVRVFYSENVKKNGTPDALASKFILNPISTPNAPRFNQ